MTVEMHTEAEVRRQGGEYGRELAAALLLASSRGDADRALKAEMARIVLRQISAAVETLEDAAFPAHLVGLYESAAREGVRDELLRSRDIAAGFNRHAA
jgi:hypothetical protein